MNYLPSIISMSYIKCSETSKLAADIIDRMFIKVARRVKS